jgi:Ni,Fe-hydrogenase III small subunit/formate hydrogenlyase subunit 6/NADH:ubiquinone oxidoreductase subunit I
MFKILRARFDQGKCTVRYPAEEPNLPDRFRGSPALDSTKCPDECRACVAACPTGAIAFDEEGLRLDQGLCLFCTECTEACPEGAIRFTSDYRLAVRTREDLILRGETAKRATALDKKMKSLFGRSLKLRQVSAGGCNACEADLNVLSTIVFDLGRFGIQFVASPRHADGIVITGPVTANMTLALKKTYDAIPAPKIAIAVGACAISGGPYVNHAQAQNGAESVVPIDLFIPGCPPHPFTILDGLLRLLGRIEDDSAKATSWAARAKLAAKQIEEENVATIKRESIPAVERSVRQLGVDLGRAEREEELDEKE